MWYPTGLPLQGLSIKQKGQEQVSSDHDYQHTEKHRGRCPVHKKVRWETRAALRERPNEPQGPQHAHTQVYGYLQAQALQLLERKRVTETTTLLRTVPARCAAV